MVKICYRENAALGKHRLAKLKKINEVLEDFSADGYVLTLRQLYYQLVTMIVIPNKTTEYRNLSVLLSEGRMAGLVDWDAIEDRLRVPYLEYWVHSVDHALADTIEQFKLDRMRGQKYHIELWVEKDALSGVLKRITDHYHIRLMVNRGYSSVSAMHDAYRRFATAMRQGKKVRILYLGDHDPSGLDMVRDIRARTLEFMGLEDYETDETDDFHVLHIGLTKEQIVKYKPPPNPAKITDSRASAYIAEHGRVSWEVDALTPKVLHEIVREEIEKIIDMDLFKEVLEEEKDGRQELVEIKDKRDEESDEDGQEDDDE